MPPGGSGSARPAACSAWVILRRTWRRRNLPAPRFLPVEAALSAEGAAIDAETACEIPVWIHALTPIRNFSKAADDNVFCRVSAGGRSFAASATPVNNVWHAPYVGPMWSQVGIVRLAEGTNTLRITELKPDACIDGIFLGFYPPFPDAPAVRIPAAEYTSSSTPSAEWRWNVLRGYSCRQVDVSTLPSGPHEVKVYFLDPGIVLQEICVFERK